jgi:hypothetical protein
VEGFLKGRELTFSAWVKSNSSDARLFQYQHGSSNRVASSAHTGGGGWEKLTVTATNNATSSNQLYFDAAIASSSFGNVSIASGDYIEISEPQLEFGSQSTPFEHELKGVTLSKCQRYFFKHGINNQNGQLVLVIDRGSNGYYSHLNWPQKMRTAPTMSEAYIDSIHKPGVRYDTITAGPNFYQLSPYGCYINVGGANTDANSTSALLGATSSNSGAIYADAEL